ncbi:MAG: DUF4783 domain-containing protein [Luteibaculum sp.]
MKNLLCIAFFSVFLVGISSQSAAQNEISRIAAAFKVGDSGELGNFLANNVSIGVDKNEQSYSRAQASQVLKSFFDRHKPSDFTYRHSGNAEHKDSFYVGSLSTNQGSFRITLFLVDTQDGKRIKRLRIEPK